jgi:endoglucanase
MQMKELALLALIISAFGLSRAQTNIDIFQLNKNLGKGINMGNMFEAPSETEWGNPFRDDYFKRIADLGFQHVRIPIRWDVAARVNLSAPYTISPTFLQRIKYVVDLAISQNLYVIINMHHHDELFQNPDGVQARFLAEWFQIAQFFKDYNQNLLFEVLNEPNTNLIGPKWNTFFANALSEIRKSNPTRAVLMGVAPWGGLGGFPQLEVPNDPNIILTIHYYDPFTFTHQGAEWVSGSDPWLGTKWENSSLERNEIIQAFQFAQNKAKSLGKPLHIGEFGAYSKADLESRIKWTNFLARWFESQNMSWAYWEWSAGFGIFNPSTNTLNQRLADALLKDAMYPEVKQTTVKIFESNFSTAGGWILQVQPSAGGSLTYLDGQAVIDISRASNDGWHVQMVKPSIALKNGSRYQVTVTASANTPLSITNYLGMARDPWSSYSGYKSISLTKDLVAQSYTFLMTAASDPVARIVLDMANTVGKITIRSIVVEEILSTPLTYSVDMDRRIKVFPNPSSGAISFSGLPSDITIGLYSSQGQFIGQNKNIEALRHTVNQLAPGIYYFRLFTGQEWVIKKWIKTAGS